MLVGHSIAGQELSSIGSRRPEKVAGLIYLDAGYSYAFYDPPSAKLLDEMQASTGPPPGPARSIMEGRQRYTNIPAPILAIFAAPNSLGSGALPKGTDRATFEARDKAMTEAVTAAFEKGLPKARVVRLPTADHYVFRSNEADVLREVHVFIAGLPK